MHHYHRVRVLWNYRRRIAGKRQQGIFLAVTLLIILASFGNQVMLAFCVNALESHALGQYLNERKFGCEWYAKASDFYEPTEMTAKEEVYIVYGEDTYTVLGGVRPEKDETEVVVPSLSFLDVKKNYFVVDATTNFPEGIVTVEELFAKDLSMEQLSEPQILIFHTHASEGYADSREGTEEDTVVGVGDVLTEYLREAGYNVVHDRTKYDVKDGVVNRDVSYGNALKGLQNNLEMYPSIEVIIDLHRDSGAKRVCEVNGVATAQVMLFNGLCRNKNGPISYLSNENLAANLAFSLQIKCLGDEIYPGFMKKIYLKGYRYNMHLAERDLLVEVGTVNNTVSEAKAAMKPFSELVIGILEGEK